MTNKFDRSGLAAETQETTYVSCECAAWEQVPADYSTYETEPMHWVPVHDWNSGFWECELWLRVFYAAKDYGKLEYGVAMIRGKQIGATNFSYRFVFRSLYNDEDLVAVTIELPEQMELEQFMDSRGRRLIEDYFNRIEQRG